MSISLAGKLTVVERNGKNGAFMVAELQTEIGIFKVKHRTLDQFPEGSFSGVFHITRVYNQSNFAKGQIWVSLYADLDWDALQIMAQNQVSEISESLEVVAMVEESEEAAVAPAPLVTESRSDAAQTVSPVLPSHQASVSEEDDLVDSHQQLDSLIEQGVAKIKLDASLDDRHLFRELRDKLKQSGYGYDVQSQSWNKR